MTNSCTYPVRICLMLTALILVSAASCSRKNSASTPPLPAPVTAAASGAWSSQSTWGGAKPVAYQEVTIPAGVTVTLDENTPALGALVINGALVFDEKDLELEAGRIEVGGAFTAGTETVPFTHMAVITLGDNPSDPRNGSDFMVMDGGVLDLHGEERGPGWTRLAQTAPAGSAELVLETSAAWRPGDRIVIASTDFDMNQAEELTVSAIAGSVVTLEAPLAYTHWGATEFGVEERAEVGLLSRNIRVQGREASASDGRGGHLMAMRGGVMRISGVEFTRMGVRGVLARYPVHFHMMGDATGSYVRDSSVHHCFNRCITIHGTHNLVITGNVAYDTLGHCYFFEDGIETGNLLENNLGLLTRLPAPSDQLTDSDDRPSTFWITNPDNIIRGNAAAGAEAFGFWYDMDEHPTGLSTTSDVFPIHTPLREFSANTAHSNGQNGMHVDGAEAGIFYRPREGGLSESSSVTATFDNFSAYKNRNRGIWFRGVDAVFSGIKVADNAIGITFAGIETFLRNSTIVGETSNPGNPGQGETTGENGRSLPKPEEPDFPVYGFEYYDGRVGVETSGFYNFVPNPTRQSGAMTTFRSNTVQLNPTNYSNSAVFSNANQVYLEPLSGDGRDGHKSAMFIDEDGTVTGAAGRAVVVNNPFMVQAACLSRTEWNASVCPDHYGRLTVINGGLASSNPLILTRQENGEVLVLDGRPDKSGEYYANILMDRLYSLQFSYSVPRNLKIRFQFRRPDDWVRLSLPYPHTPFKIIRDSASANPLKAAASLDALAAGQGDAYFHDGTNLHLKLMIRAGRTDTTIDVGP